MAIPFMLLPNELQLKILNALDSSTLATACLVSKDVCAKAVPILWHDINLESEPEKQRRFLASCDRLVEERLDHLQALAAHTRHLKFGKVLGIAIPYDDDSQLDRTQTWQLFFNANVSWRTVYNVISNFRNLEQLALFVKEPFDMDHEHEDVPQRLRFPAMKKLQVGGNLPKEVILALLATPETIEDLSCIALQDGTMSQTQEPGGLLFFSSIKERFTNLRTLHLCKMAELTEDHKGITAWHFSQDNDYAIVRDWADFLGCASGSIVNLTLEDCYLVNEYFARSDRTIDPRPRENDCDPQSWGDPSSERFREVVLPILTDRAWPRLQKLILIGLDVYEKKLEALDRFKDASPPVQVEYKLGGVMRYSYDCTPISISPRAESFGRD